MCGIGCSEHLFPAYEIACVQGSTNGTNGIPLTNGTVGNTIGSNGNANGTICSPSGTVGTIGKPMVSLATNGTTGKITNGAIGRTPNRAINMLVYYKFYDG